MKIKDIFKQYKIVLPVFLRQFGDGKRNQTSIVFSAVFAEGQNYGNVGQTLFVLGHEDGENVACVVSLLYNFFYFIFFIT